MSRVWYTSDLHFQHVKVSQLRGFSSVEEHDEQLISNWNSAVHPKDIVWVLGDVAIGSGGLPKVDRLNGTKHLITGNHDACFPMHRNAHKAQVKWLQYFDSVQAYARRKVLGVEFLLSHFPYTGDHTAEIRYPEYRLQDTGMLLVHGHTHQPYYKRPEWRNQIHVGVDAWDLFPVSQETVVDRLREWDDSNALV